MNGLIALQGSQTRQLDRKRIMTFKTVKTSGLYPYADDMNNSDANSIDPNLLKSLKPDTSALALLNGTMPVYGSFSNAWGGSANSGGTAGTGPISSTSSTSFSSLVGTSPINVGSLTTTNPATVQHPGSGLVFNNTFDSTCTQQYINCVVAAEYTLSTLFTNSLTVSVSFTAANQGNNGLALGNNWGWTGNNWVNVSYATLQKALSGTGDLLPQTDPNPAGGSSDWNLPEAYARMLGLSKSTPDTSKGQYDDTLTLNTWSGNNWVYGQDLINGVIHELSEGIMGRVGGLGDKNTAWSTMDLFRYAPADATHSSPYLDTGSTTRDGRDGITTYFSSDGGQHLSSTAGLAFNNEYTSPTNQANTGDPADWKSLGPNTAYAVFGDTNGGEVFTLNQTEFNVMAALGWNTQIPQAVFTATPSGDWQTATNWRDGFAPITPQDALIGSGSNSTAVSSVNVTVNSITTDKLGTLEIAGNSVFTATNGTQPNPNDNDFSGGNNGNINVDAGSTLTTERST
jgi:hypothetical protein